MMPLFFSVVLALSWGVMSSLQTLEGAVSTGGDAPVVGFSVSPHSFTPALLAAQASSRPEVPDAADKKSPVSRRKQPPAPMSIAMWFGVLGATLLILPRLRRR